MDRSRIHLTLADLDRLEEAREEAWRAGVRSALRSGLVFCLFAVAFLVLLETFTGAQEHVDAWDRARPVAEDSTGTYAVVPADIGQERVFVQRGGRVRSSWTWKAGALPTLLMLPSPMLVSLAPQLTEDDGQEARKRRKVRRGRSRAASGLERWTPPPPEPDPLGGLGTFGTRPTPVPLHYNATPRTLRGVEAILVERGDGSTPKGSGLIENPLHVIAGTPAASTSFPPPWGMRASPPPGWFFDDPEPDPPTGGGVTRYWNPEPWAPGRYETGADFHVIGTSGPARHGLPRPIEQDGGEDPDEPDPAPKRPRKCQ